MGNVRLRFRGRSASSSLVFYRRGHCPLKPLAKEGPIVQWIPACRQAGNGGFNGFVVMKKFVIYVIESQIDARLYVGFTEFLERRIKEHNDGKTKSTKGFRPWILVYSEVVSTREEARKREKYLKSGCGKEFLKLILHKNSRPYSSMDRTEVS